VSGDRAEALARARGRLRDLALLCLLLVPVELALLALLRELRDESRGLAWDLARVWSGRLALLLPLAALAFGLVALAVPLLPGGREAAAREPMILWRRRRDRPVRVSLVAVLLAFGLLAGGGFAAIDATRGTLALGGAGASFTIGEDATVVERRRVYPRGVTIFAETPAGRVVLEGGSGRRGERYVAYPEDAARAWRADLGGAVLVAFAAAVALAAIACAVLIAAWQWRRRRAASEPAAPRTGAGLGLWAAAALLALAATGTALATQAASYRETATVDVPELGAAGAPSRLRIHATRAPVARPAAEDARAGAGDEPPPDVPLRLRVTLARYADAAAADRAAGAWGAAEERAADGRGRRVIELDGAVGVTADDEGESLRLGRAAGDVLVVVELEPGDGGIVVPVGRDAVERTLLPRARAVLDAAAAAAPRLLGARLAWWR
jgi:hypothetical protein